MFLAIIGGASLWYPAVLSQPLLTPLRDVPSVVVVLLLFGAILLGACVAARPGKRLMLAGVLIAFGALSPLPLRARVEAARFVGSRPDVVLLGLDSISHTDDVGEFGKWVERQGARGMNTRFHQVFSQTPCGPAFSPCNPSEFMACFTRSSSFRLASQRSSRRLVLMGTEQSPSFLTS